MSNAPGDNPNVLAAGAIHAYAAELPRGDRRQAMSALAEALAGSDARTTVPGDMLGWFDRFYVAHAAGDSLRPLGELLRQTDVARNLWKRRFVAGLYPALIAGEIVVVMTLLGRLAWPTFGAIYDDFNLQLPLSTRLFLSWSQLVSERLGMLVASIAAIGCVVLIVYLSRRRWAFPLAGRLSAGSIGNVADAAQFTQRIAGYLDSGETASGAVAVASQTCQSRWLQRSGARWATTHEKNLGEGGPPLAAADTELRSFPPIVATILGETTVDDAARARLLRAVADAYAERVELRHGGAAGYVTPLAITLLGICILFIMCALLLPLVDLINWLGG